jgi:predicted MPP superfamily phosphohydrolase
MLLIALTLAAIVYINTNFFIINRVRIFSNKIPQGKTVKILQIADMHNRFFDQGNQKLIKRIKQAKPDLIVITGDFIDARTRNLSDALELSKELAEISQVFFVSGNHEWRNKNRKKFMDALEERGINILNNQNKVISFGNFKINLAGVDDFSSRHGDPEKALSGINKNYFTLLLSHDPMIIKKDLSNFDLILSGHTHGGQIRVPLVGALILPGHSSLPEYDRGVFSLPNGGSLYIDSGLGTSILPIRFWCQAQISLVTLMGTGTNIDSCD